MLHIYQHGYSLSIKISFGVMKINAKCAQRPTYTEELNCKLGLTQDIWNNIREVTCCHVCLFIREDSNKDLKEIGAANFAVLERIRVNRREEHLKVVIVAAN